MCIWPTIVLNERNEMEGALVLLSNEGLYFETCLTIKWMNVLMSVLMDSHVIVQVT